MTRIIDLSSNNGLLSDDIKDAPIDGAIVKLTGGTTYVNPLFDQQVGMLRKHNIPFAAYHYAAEPTGNPANGNAEWPHFKSQVDRYPDIGFLALDCEERGASAQYYDEFSYACSLETSWNPYTYTGDWFARNVLVGARSTKMSPLWFANPENAISNPPPPWQEIAINQYSWHGRIPGVATEVDLSLSPHPWAELCAMGRWDDARWPFSWETEQPIIAYANLGGRGRIVKAEFIVVNEDNPSRPLYFSTLFDQGRRIEYGPGNFWRVI